MKNARGTRLAQLLAGGLATTLLSAAVLGAAPALADEVPVDGSGAVPLTLEVGDAGELSMSVDTSPVVFTETPSTATNRTFAGTLPTVTVTDTRATVPEAVAWSVVGQADDFTSEDGTVISNEYLGWAPALVEEPTENEGWVGAGDEVASVAENGTGLTKGFDLLIGSFDSTEAQDVSTEWKATAELHLVAPAQDLQSGTYSSTLTLSLFEY